MWYAIQVETGREEETLIWISRAAESEGVAGAFEELFVPRRVLFERVGPHAWERRESPLFPGYLIADVPHKRDLGKAARALRSAPRLARMLSCGGVFAPISDSETAVICAFTGRQGHVVGVSEGFVEKGRVTIVSGPLVGREAMVTKVNRRRKTARVRLSICGREVETELALELMRQNKDRATPPA